MVHSEPGTTLNGTYYSNPVIAVINGQRLLISRRGRRRAARPQGPHRRSRSGAMSFGKGVINGVAGRRRQPRLLHPRRGEPRRRRRSAASSAWTPRRSIPRPRSRSWSGTASSGRTRRIGASLWPTDSGSPPPALRRRPAVLPGRLAANCSASGAKDGELLWKYRYATEVRGAPLIADGKLYIFDVKAKHASSSRSRARRQPSPDDDVRRTGSPSLGGAAERDQRHPDRRERPRLFHHPHRPVLPRRAGREAGVRQVHGRCRRRRRSSANAIAGVRLFPADVTAKPGEKVTFKVVLRRRQRPRGAGQPALAAGEWTLRPAAQDADRGASRRRCMARSTDGTLTLRHAADASRGTSISSAATEGRARGSAWSRQLPYKQDFDKVPAGGRARRLGERRRASSSSRSSRTATSVLRQGEHRRPAAAGPGQRLHHRAGRRADYTIQADVMGTRGPRQDARHRARATAATRWCSTARPIPATGKRRDPARVVGGASRGSTSAAEFDWAAGHWYTVKLTVEQKEKTAMLRGQGVEEGRGRAGEVDHRVRGPEPQPQRGGGAVRLHLQRRSRPTARSRPARTLYYDNVSDHAQREEVTPARLGERGAEPTLRSPQWANATPLDSMTRHRPSQYGNPFMHIAPRHQKALLAGVALAAGRRRGRAGSPPPSPRPRPPRPPRPAERPHHVRRHPGPEHGRTMTDKSVPDASVGHRTRTAASWKAELGSRAYGGPIVAGGKIFVRLAMITITAPHQRSGSRPRRSSRRR